MSGQAAQTGTAPSGLVRATVTPDAGADVRDPSMAEILASIQRILSEGEPDDRAAHPAAPAEPAASAAANHAQAVAPPAPTHAHDAARVHEAPDMHDDQEPPIGDADVLILEKSMMVAPDGALAEPLYKSPLLEAAISRDAGNPPPPPAFGLTAPHPFPLPEEPEVAASVHAPALQTPAFHTQPVAHAEPAAPPALEAEPPQAVAWSPPPAAPPAATPVAAATVLPAPVAREPAPVAAPPVAVSHSLPVAQEPPPVTPPAAAPMAVPDAPPPAAPALATDGLVGAATAAVAATAIGNLVRTITAERNVPVQRGGLTIEDLVREELRPLLRAWLETHLPPLVEKLVQVEIERVVNRATS